MSVGEMLQEELGGVLAGLEEERKRRISTVLVWGAWLSVITLAVAGWFRFRADSWNVGMVALVVALAVWIYSISRQGGQFAGAFKALVMPELVRALGEELEYWPGSCLDEAEFCECRLFKDPDRYYGSDLVTGWVGDTHIRFSLVHAEEERTVTETVTETDSNGHTSSHTRTRTEYHTIFRGLIFSADCNKEFNGLTLVTAGGSGFLSRLHKTFVNLEDPGFLKAFTVYASDQVEARYLLTPKLMERILALREQVGSSLQLSFAGDRVYVAFAMGLNAFTPSLWKRIDDLGAVGRYYGTLRLITDVVDGLDLNTRIWSKR